MANRKDPPKSKEMLAPLWVTTYSDLISLLVTFFVLLFTFSTMESDKLKRVQGTLGGGRGEMTEDRTQSRPNVRRQDVPPGAVTDPYGVESPSRRQELEVRRELVRLVQDPSFDVPVTAELLGDGLRITLEGDRIFGPGTTIMLPEAEQTIREVARLVRSMPVSLAVEAHVDSQFSRLSRFRDPVVMTREMALNVAAVLIEETGWPPTRVAIAPMGTTRPRADNDSPVGRQKNRRVEILILRYKEADRNV